MALMSQVPYTALMLSSYSIFQSIFDNNEKYSRLDDLSFMYKFMTRFGAMTIATTLATVACYPLETIKRRI